jgi:hypothetical protein
MKERIQEPEYRSQEENKQNSEDRGKSLPSSLSKGGA